jgi:enoyl-CoA hydratase/carnithine racemase
VTIAVVDDRAPRAPLLAGFDLVATEAAAIEPWLAAFVAHAQAATVLVRLLREPEHTLERESLAYSLLQAGPEFAAWLAARGPSRPAGDTADRAAVATDGAVAAVVLTRPARRNAFDAAMREALCDALDAAAGARAVTLRGEGVCFSSGGDLAEFGTLVDPTHSHLVRTGRSVPARLQRLGPRLVAGVHGPCIGAGVELPTFAAHVIAASDATFRLPEVGFGLIPGAGGTVSIPRRIGRARFLDLALTGRALDAATAQVWGLVDEVVGSEALPGRVAAVAEALAAG